MSDYRTKLLVGENLTSNGFEIFRNNSLFCDLSFKVKIKRFSVIVLYARDFSIENSKRIVNLFTIPSVSEIIFVVGENKSKELIKSEIDICWGKVALNANPHDVIYSSLKIGLRAVSIKSDYIVIQFGTMAKLEKETIKNIFTESQKSNKKIFIPIFDGKRGHPIIFSYDLIHLLFSLRKEKGLPYILRHYKNYIAEIPVKDKFVIQKQ